MSATFSAQLLAEKDLCRTTGLSRWYWADRRRDQSLIEGIHYVRISSRNLRYRLDLIHDGLTLGFDSPEHQRSCQRFLESLPSGLRAKKIAIRLEPDRMSKKMIWN